MVFVLEVHGEPLGAHEVPMGARGPMVPLVVDVDVVLGKAGGGDTVGSHSGRTTGESVRRMRCAPRESRLGAVSKGSRGLDRGLASARWSEALSSAPLFTARASWSVVRSRVSIKKSA